MIIEIILLTLPTVGLLAFLVVFIRRCKKREHDAVLRINKLKEMYKPHESSKSEEVMEFLNLIESNVGSGRLAGILKPSMEIIDLSIAVYNENDINLIAEDLYAVAKQYGREDFVIRNRDSLFMFYAQITAKCD